MDNKTLHEMVADKIKASSGRHLSLKIINEMVKEQWPTEKELQVYLAELERRVQPVVPGYKFVDKEPRAVKRNGSRKRSTQKEKQK